MTSDYIQANTDGRLHPATEPSLSPLNRGFLYGDAIYEVWRTFEGILFAFEAHWQRLERSARALEFELPLQRAQLLEEIRRTAAAFFAVTGQRTELYIRLQLSRGAGPIGLNPALADRASFVLLVQALKETPPAKQREGIRLSVATRLRRNHPGTLNPAWKTGNYLNNILCLREALARGAEEVVMTNLAGEITEAAVSNIFFVRGNTLCTPPLAAGILEGITRAAILDEVAPRAGLSRSEAPIRVEELATFEECFITGTTKNVLPVSSIDDYSYQVGPHTLTSRIGAAFNNYVREQIERSAELWVMEPLTPSLKKI